MGVENFFVNEKAVIEILDLRELGEVIEKSTKKSDNGLSFSQDAQKEMTKYVSSTKQDSRILTTSLTDMLGSASDNLDLSGVRLSGMKKTFEVQFNPSDLHLEGHGGGRISKTVYNKDAKSNQLSGNIVYDQAPVNINLNVKLLFDRMDANESFLSAKTNVAASELVKSGVSAVVKKVKKELTVQQEVEGLVAALRSPYTRKICFYWGDLCYTGVLNRVASQYTMFNTAGEPVRAYVQLSLICADESVSDVSMGQWEQAYETAFNGGSKSLVDWSQKVGSVLNFSK